MLLETTTISLFGISIYREWTEIVMNLKYNFLINGVA